jgi:[ribosomal protein S5]-alanine N-acetyltransferase
MEGVSPKEVSALAATGSIALLPTDWCATHVGHRLEYHRASQAHHTLTHRRSGPPTAATARKRATARGWVTGMEIITRRFLLREFTDDDGPVFLAYHADPRYAAFSPLEDVGPDHARVLLQRFKHWATEQPRRNYQLAIAPRRNPGELLGCCGLRGEGYSADQAEFGIELAPPHWGRYGYAIEVASALLAFGFRELALQEVRGFSHSANTRVTRLARRYGAVMLDTGPGPSWMLVRGWRQTAWQLTRERWMDIAAV